MASRATIAAAWLLAAALSAAGSGALPALADGAPPKKPKGTKPPAGKGDTAPAPGDPAKAAGGGKGEAADKKREKDWAKVSGGLGWVRGYAAGLDEAWKQGRPVMLFFVSSKVREWPMPSNPDKTYSVDQWVECMAFAEKAWNDPEVLDCVKRYLPVVVDADTDDGKEGIKKHPDVAFCPATVWVDYDDVRIFSVVGNPGPEVLHAAAKLARDQAPAVHVPEEVGIAARMHDDLARALAAGAVKKALEVATAMSALKRPRSARVEGDAALVDLNDKGLGRLEEAKKLLAAGKSPEAEKALADIALDYVGYPIGRDAIALIDSMSAKPGK